MGHRYASLHLKMLVSIEGEKYMGDSLTRGPQSHGNSSYVKGECKRKREEGLKQTLRNAQV